MSVCMLLIDIPYFVSILMPRKPFKNFSVTGLYFSGTVALYDSQ